jgi:hypothetical protein
MAISSGGPYGNIRGILGNIEWYVRNGQNLMRTRRTKSTKPKSAGRLANEMRIALVNKFLGSMLPFIREGYPIAIRSKPSQSAHNAAMSYITKNAVTGEYPDLKIDYTKVLLTKGNLSNAGLNFQVKFRYNKVIYSWIADNSPAHYSDKLMALMYAPSLNESLILQNSALKSSGSDRTVFPSVFWHGIEVYVYLSFVSPVTRQCSNSIVIGPLTTPKLDRTNESN